LFDIIKAGKTLFGEKLTFLSYTCCKNQNTHLAIKIVKRKLQTKTNNKAILNLFLKNL